MSSPKCHPGIGCLSATAWILSRLNGVNRKVDKALEEYRFNDAALALYQFTWHELCDWYIEVIKPALTGGASGDGARAILGRVLERTLRLLHPILPYITEEIWQRLPGREGESIMIAPWPSPDPDWDDPSAEEDFGRLTEVIGGVRNIRGELNIPPGKEVRALIHVEDPVRERLLLHEAEWVKRLAKILPDWTIGSDVSRPKTAAAAVGDGFQIFVPIGGLIDPEEEIRRLEKQLSDVAKDIGNLEKKLAMPSFLERAPAAVVEKDRNRLGDAQNREAKLRDSLSRLMEIKG